MTQRRTLHSKLIGTALLLVLWGNAAPVFAEITIDDIPKPPKKTTTLKCGGQDATISVTTGAKFTVRTGAKAPAPQIEAESILHFQNGIALTYKGPNCASCKRLQFVWRTIEVFRGPKSLGYVGGDMPGTKTGKLTKPPAAPNYHVDSGSGNPYADEPGINEKTEGDTSNFFDQPGPGIPTNYQTNPPPFGLTKIISVAHFDTFFVCDGTICAKVSWTITYTWTPGPNGGTYSDADYDVSDPEVPGTINDAEKTALITEYPGQTIPK